MSLPLPVHCSIPLLRIGNPIRSYRTSPPINFYPAIITITEARRAQALLASLFTPRSGSKFSVFRRASDRARRPTSMADFRWEPTIMEHGRRRKCRNCGKQFTPDRRNWARQHYCGEPVCKKASRQNSQHRWQRSKKGRDYFSGHANVLRVTEWRKTHPNYWRKRTNNQESLQDFPFEHLLDSLRVRPDLTADALQDILRLHTLMLIGFTSILAGTRKKDNIDGAVRSVILRGRKIQRLLGSEDGFSSNSTPLNSPASKTE